MDTRQSAGQLGMFDRDRKGLETMDLQSAREISEQRRCFGQFAYSGFGRDFPCAGSAYEYDICRIGNGQPDWQGDALVACPIPKEGMCIEQKRWHGQTSSPYQRRSSSSGNGSNASSGICPMMCFKHPLRALGLNNHQLDHRLVAASDDDLFAFLGAPYELRQMRFRCVNGDRFRH